MSVLEVRHLGVGFQTRAGFVRVVDDVGFEVEEGQTLALVGESGSGKTVTALALMSLLPQPPARIDSGEVWLGGFNLLALGELDLRRIRGNKIAIVFQDPSSALHPLYTVGAQMSEVLQLHRGQSRRAARNLCVRALGDVGIADPELRFDAYPHELSGGTQQRVMIAMALLCEPKVLIADEPTTALDVTVQAEILDLLERLQHAHGTAILLISHDLAMVASVADAVCVMYAGRIVESASAGELFAQPAHPYTLGLLACTSPPLARLDLPLVAIPGAPPSMSSLPSGCAFHPRCTFKVARCETERPLLARWEPPEIPVQRDSGEPSAEIDLQREASEPTAQVDQDREQREEGERSAEAGNDREQREGDEPSAEASHDREQHEGDEPSAEASHDREQHEAIKLSAEAFQLPDQREADEASAEARHHREQHEASKLSAAALQLRNQRLADEARADARRAREQREADESDAGARHLQDQRRVREQSDEILRPLTQEEATQALSGGRRSACHEADRAGNQGLTWRTRASKSGDAA